MLGSALIGFLFGMSINLLYSHDDMLYYVLACGIKYNSTRLNMAPCVAINHGIFYIDPKIPKAIKRIAVHIKPI